MDGSFTTASRPAGSPVIAPGHGRRRSTAQRMLSQTGFALLQTAGWRSGACAPSSAAGGGVTHRILLHAGARASPGHGQLVAAAWRASPPASTSRCFADHGADRPRQLHPHVLAAHVHHRSGAAASRLFGSLARRGRRPGGSVLSMSRARVALLLLVLPALALGALGLVIVATGAAPRRARRAGRARRHFAARQPSASRWASRSAVARRARRRPSACCAPRPCCSSPRWSRPPPCSSPASACAPRAPAAGCGSARFRAARRRS